MSHDSPEPQSDGDISQAVFLGWVAVGLLIFMAVFTIVVLGVAAMHGFS